MHSTDGAAGPIRRAEKRLFAIHMAIALLFVLLLVAAPIAVDNLHMDDTVLLANVGWRGVNGLFPVVDYPHFYGGLTEAFVTVAFAMFGVDYKSIDYAFVMLFLFTAPLAWAVCWKRISLAELGLMTAIGAALIVSLDPLEDPAYFTVAHSFVYNHIGVFLMLALTIFTCVKLESRRAELASAFAAGVALYVLLLVKTTFGVIAPALLLGCLVQRRFASIGLVLLGAALTMIVTDFGMVRTIGSLQTLLASDAAVDAGGLEGRVLGALLMIKAQLLPIAIAAILTYVILKRRTPGGPILVATLLLCGAAYGAAMLATGGRLELKLLPFLIVATLLLSRKWREGASDDDSLRRIVRLVPWVFAHLLIVPAIATAVLAFVQSVSHAKATLVTEGPLASYIAVDRKVLDAGDDSLSLPDRRALATQETLRHLKSSDEVSDRDEYVMFAEGLDLLRQVPNVASFGIVTSGRMFEYTAPLRSKIVMSYPIWPSYPSFEATRHTPLGPDVDLVMMLDEVPPLGLVTEALRERMAQDFRLCRRSTFWTLYARRNAPAVLCAAPAR